MISFASIIQQVPALIFWKDTNLNFLGCNRAFAEICNLESKDVIGKNDFDMPWAEKEGKRFRADDLGVLAGASKTNSLEMHYHPNGTIITLIGSKVPLLDEQGKTIGVIGNYYDATKYITETSIGDNAGKNYYLTDRQKECLIYLCKGMTAKHIAKAINISSRTVEHHIEVLKGKLSCTSRAHLIEKALTFEFIKHQILF